MSEFVTQRIWGCLTELCVLARSKFISLLFIPSEINRPFILSLFERRKGWWRSRCSSFRERERVRERERKRARILYVCVCSLCFVNELIFTQTVALLKFFQRTEKYFQEEQKIRHKEIQKTNVWKEEWSRHKSNNNNSDWLQSRTTGRSIKKEEA